MKPLLVDMVDERNVNVMLVVKASIVLACAKICLRISVYRLDRKLKGNKDPGAAKSQNIYAFCLATMNFVIWQMTSNH